MDTVTVFLVLSLACLAFVGFVAAWHAYYVISWYDSERGWCRCWRWQVPRGSIRQENAPVYCAMCGSRLFSGRCLMCDR